MVKAQEYFNNKYKKNVTYLKVEEPISDKLTGKLTGLTLNSPDLEVINLAENKIKSLTSVNLGANPLSYLHKINITSLKNNLSLNLLGQLVELKEENEELRGRKEQSQNEKLKAQITRLEEENTNLRKAQAEAMKQIRIGLEKLEVNIEVAPK
ncbi:19081_t:CDS:2 [Racocetra fulgida]|uniref:19081_t:CDS:1 n=1 Tax=Racocetra fulgida TaxID=60492 RepID=A0A9N8Z201_9GLOM|nr:19081_t:CDS:2 [Racocetra fulgida]